VWIRILATGEERDADNAEAMDLIRRGHACRQNPPPKFMLDLAAKVEALEKRVLDLETRSARID
jgi:hypothetical protein